MVAHKSFWRKGWSEAAAEDAEARGEDPGVKEKKIGPFGKRDAND